LRHIDLAGVVGIFTSDYWSGFHGDRSGLYRPLTVLSYALQYGGNHALPYHLLNLLLHAACTWGLYRFVKRLGQNESLALGSALLFAVHPALSEGVYAIVGRADLMAAALSLVALNLHLRNTLRRAALATVALILALLCKESAIALLALLPLASLFQYRSFSQKCYSRSYLLYGLATLLYLAWRYHVLGSLGTGEIDPLDNALASAPTQLRILDAVLLVFRYLGLLVLPAHLSADYSSASLAISSTLWSTNLILALCGLAVLAVLVFFAWRRLPPLFFGISWTLLAIAPVANIILPIGTIMGERLLYLPAMGFCIGTATLLKSLSGRRAIFITSLLVALLAARTVRRGADWQDNYTLFLQTTQVQPQSARAWRGLGRAALERGQQALALSSFGRALHIWPSYYEVHNDLATYYLEQQRPEDARQHLASAMQMRPDYPPAWYNLGLALYRLERPQEARRAFEQALTLDPTYADAAYNLGVLLLEQNERDEASAFFLRTLAIDPQHAAARHNLKALKK
jgi:Tfp pilus assembly protein PilF